MKRLSTFLVACALALLTACAALGVESPQTFNEKLAVAVATNAEVRNTATTLLLTGKITAADAANIQAQADVAREGLNVARSLSATDFTSAGSRLEVTSAALRAIQTYLLSKGAKP
jgi:hypothetical protein